MTMMVKMTFDEDDDDDDDIFILSWLMITVESSFIINLSIYHQIIGMYEVIIIIDACMVLCVSTLYTYFY
jgi:hypothetical protein